MIGLFSWVALGMVADWVTTRLMAGRDMGLTLFTTAVGIAGALLGGFVGVFLDVGAVATISLFGLLAAALGSAVTLASYRRLMGV